MIGDKKGNVSILLEFFDLAIMVTLISSGTSNSKALGADMIEMLQEEGAIVGLGGGYQPQPGDG